MFKKHSLWPLLVTLVICTFFAQLSYSLDKKAMSMKITTKAFEDGKRIPTAFTEDGRNVSPALSWSGVPAGTKSLALICDDPDAPMGTWVHWVVYNLPPDLTALTEGAGNQPNLAHGGKQGKNSWGKVGYGGPAPPAGKVHRYFFKLYALDQKLNLEGTPSKDQLLAASKGHVIGEAGLIGTYSR